MIIINLYDNDIKNKKTKKQLNQRDGEGIKNQRNKFLEECKTNVSNVRQRRVCFFFFTDFLFL